jgi:acetyl-CoA/propionyl-CoA carboxylase carboxyl transferase subunit
MNSHSLGATKVYAWPGAEVAVMGAVAAVRILHRRRLADVPEDLRAQTEKELAVEHAQLAGGLTRAVEHGVIDEVIDPKWTRSVIARAIVGAPQVRGNHGNIPL